MSIRPVRDGDVEPLSAVLARAFHDDPVTGWVYGTERRRAHWVGRFFRWQLRRLLPQDASWTTEAHDGAALWALPGQWREDVRETARLLRATLLGVVPRLPRVLKGLSEVEARHPEQRHMYLAVLGVDPERQGEGVGSRLIRPGLDLCDREGLPAYLETGKERNLDFYGRHGFAIREELRLPKGPPIWLLWRDPTS
jgi:predicted N-acetyltransferase YhbS